MSMRLSLVLLACIALIACESESMSNERRASAAMSAPPENVPVGPIPGVGSERRALDALQNPLAGEAGAVQDGRRLFVAMNCSGCHGGRAGGGMGPSLRDEEWIYGNDDARIFDSIAAGRANGMPAWGTRLPSQEIWKLVSYIQSLRTDREPQAP